jgi:glycogen debranching enzyme
LNVTDSHLPVAARLVDECSRQSLALLQRNLTPAGILAASPGPAAEAKSYTRIFGRDAAICALGMIGCGVAAVERGAIASLDSLAAQQAPNGQIPKYVDEAGEEADFWYLGCIDATLWWLLAVHHVRGHVADAANRWQPQVEIALNWLTQAKFSQQ